jgi:hypothetical protein
VQLSEYLRHFHAVRHIVIAGRSLLSQMCLLAETEGAREEVGIEPLEERIVAEIPSRYDGVQCRCAHKSPASAKLT